MSLNVGAITGAIIFEDEFSKPIKHAQKSADDFSKSASEDFDNVSKKSKGAKDSIDNLGSAMQTLAGAVAALGILDAAIGVSKLGAEMEQTRVAMEVFLGSAEQANQVIEQLNDFANVTPFQNDEIIRAGKSLLAFGLEADKLQETLKNIGNVSAGTGKDFNELSVIYGKAMTQGVIQAEELNQLTEAGVPIIKVLAKQMGVAENQVKKMGSEGLIAFSDLEKAFASMSEEGGQFFQLMDKQSKTFAGLMSTLNGVTTAWATDFGEALNDLLKPALEFIVNLVNDMYQAWRELDDSTKEIIVAVVAVTAAFVAFLLILPALKIAILAVGSAMNAAFIASPIGWVIGGIAASIALVTAAVIKMKNNWEQFDDFFRPVIRAWDDFSEIVGDVVDGFTEIAESIGVFDDAFEGLGDAGAEVDIFATAIKASLFPIVAIIAAVAAGIKALRSLIQGLVDSGEQLVSVAAELAKLSVALVQGPAGIVQWAMGGGAEDIKQAFEALGESMSEPVKDAGEAIKTAMVDIQNSFEDIITIKSTPKTKKSAEEAGKDDGKTYVKGVENGTEEGEKKILEWWQKVGKALESDESMVASIGKLFDDDISKAVSASAGEIADSIGKIFDAAITNLEAGFEHAQANLEATGDILDFIGDLQSKKAQQRNEEELTELETLWDQKIRIAKDGLAEIELMQDEAWQKQKERMQLEYEARVEQARLDYELKLAQIEQDYADEEQRRVNKELMEESWLRRQQELEQEHLNNVSEARQQHSNETQARIKTENDRIVEMEASKDDAVTSLKEKQAQEEKKREKEVAIFKTMIEYQKFQASKQAQLAQVTISFAQAIMSAVQAAASIATIPIIGWALAPVVLATLSTMAAATYNTSRAAIQSQRFVPPTEVFMAEGGLLAGPSHAAGGIAVRAEGGERIIDAERTDRFNRWIDRETLGDGNNDQQPIIVHVNMNGAHIWGVMDPKTAEMIGEKVAVYTQRKIEQRMR